MNLLPGLTKVLPTKDSSPSKAKSQLGQLCVRYSPSVVDTSGAKPETVCCYECCQIPLYVC